ELAADLSHRRRLLEQRPVSDREIAADHAAVAVDQAVGNTIPVLGKRPRARFGMVSPTVRDQIYPLINLSADEFTAKLRPCTKAFEEWRYIYELPGKQIDYDFLYAAANSFFAIAMTLIESPAGSVAAPRGGHN